MGELLKENPTNETENTENIKQNGGYPAIKKKYPKKIGGYPANYSINKTITSKKGKRKTKGKKKLGKKRKYLTLRNIQSKSQSKKD